MTTKKITTENDEPNERINNYQLTHHHLLVVKVIDGRIRFYVCMLVGWMDDLLG